MFHSCQKRKKKITEPWWNQVSSQISLHCLHLLLLQVQADNTINRSQRNIKDWENILEVSQFNYWCEQKASVLTNHTNFLLDQFWFIRQVICLISITISLHLFTLRLSLQQHQL